MSRSYKKTPYHGDRKTIGKKFANRKVRRSGKILNNSSYKKLYPQYDVCDFYSKYTSFNDYSKHMKNVYNMNLSLYANSEKEELNHFMKYFIRK